MNCKCNRQKVIFPVLRLPILFTAWLMRIGLGIMDIHLQNNTFNG